MKQFPLKHIQFLKYKSANNTVSTNYFPKFFLDISEGTIYYSKDGGELIIALYDTKNIVTEDTFSLYTISDDESEIEISEVNFNVPIKKI